MNSRTGDVLLRARIIDELQLRSALAHQQQWGGRLADIVVEKRFATVDAVLDTLAAGLNVPRVRLAEVEKDAAAIARVDVAFARERAVFPCALKDNGKTLWLAMVDPTDVPTLDELALKTHARVRPVIASGPEIRAAIDRHYLGREPGSEPQAFGAIVPSFLGDDDEDGKVVDMSGRTLVRKLSDLPKAVAAPEPAPAEAAPSPSRVDAMLDDLLGAGTAASWTPELLERLRMIQDQQEKSARVLRAVLELCIERGLVRLDEYRARLTKA